MGFDLFHIVDTWKSYLSHTSQHVGRSRASHASLPGPTCRVGASKVGVDILSFISAQCIVQSFSWLCLQVKLWHSCQSWWLPNPGSLFKDAKLKNLENALNSRECLNFRKCWKSWGKNASGVTYDSKPRKGGILCRLPSSCLIWFWLRPWLRWGWYGIGGSQFGASLQNTLVKLLIIRLFRSNPIIVLWVFSYLEVWIKYWGGRGWNIEGIKYWWEVDIDGEVDRILMGWGYCILPNSSSWC